MMCIWVTTALGVILDHDRIIVCVTRGKENYKKLNISWKPYFFTKVRIKIYDSRL